MSYATAFLRIKFSRLPAEVEGEVYVEGGNYRVTLGTDGVAYVRVGRRPDVSRDVEAGYAVEMAKVFERLMQQPWTRVRGVLLDFTNASMAWGPVTEQAVIDLCNTMENAARWLSIVTAPEAVAMMTASNVVKKHAPRCGRVFGSPLDGQAWAGQRKRLG